VRGPDDAATLMRVLVCDDHHDGEFVIALDGSDRFVGYASRDGDQPWAPLDAMQLGMIAGELRADAVVLVTFVGDERIAPSPADVARYEGLVLVCADEGIALLDQLLMSGHRWRSVGEVSVGRDA
jgi:hypothetical protein